LEKIRNLLQGIALYDGLRHRRPTHMSEELSALLEAAKRAEPSSEHREEQRRTFAYGNTAFENRRITREMVDREAEKLAREKHDERS
jgi:hypothetical protein